MRLRGTLMAVFVLAVCLLTRADSPPLKAGERLRYSVSWAIVPGAGEIVVQAAQTGPDQLTVTSTTATRRLARVLLPFDATSESIYDSSSGRLLRIHERSTTRGKYREHIATFDYESRQASYAKIGATLPRLIPMPAGSPNDLISALLETRTWSIRPGEKRDVLVIFDDDFYELTIHALHYENVTTPLGSFRTLVLEPRMEKTPPKGMFRRGSTVKVWIAQDERKLPVKFEVMFNIGTGTAVLESYTPPGTAPTGPRKR